MSEPQEYVADRNGMVWYVTRDGGMVTRADFAGITSAGIAWLETEAGPLTRFTAADLTAGRAAIAERDEALAAVERVRALRNGWEKDFYEQPPTKSGRIAAVGIARCAKELTAALDGPAPEPATAPAPRCSKCGHAPHLRGCCKNEPYDCFCQVTS